MLILQVPILLWDASCDLSYTYLELWDTGESTVCTLERCWENSRHEERSPAEAGPA